MDHKKQMEEVAREFGNGRVTKDEAHAALDKAVEKTIPKVVSWMKACLFWIFVVAFVLPSLGVTAVLFAWAYSLVK